MTTDIHPLETYNGQVARLDRPHIEGIGALVRIALDAGNVVGVSYQPDNGTAYNLVFTPVEAIRQVGVGWRVPTGCFDADGNPLGDGRYVLVSKCNGAESDWSAVFDLSPGHRHHVSYVGPKIRSNIADAAAIVALFRMICGSQVYDFPS